MMMAANLRTTTVDRQLARRHAPRIVWPLPISRRNQKMKFWAEPQNMPNTKIFSRNIFTAVSLRRMRSCLRTLVRGGLELLLVAVVMAVVSVGVSRVLMKKIVTQARRVRQQHVTNRPLRESIVKVFNVKR